MTQDQSDTQRTVRPATHVVNVTSVIHTTNVRIPLQEIVALIKLRGLVIPVDAQLQAVLNTEQGVLTISWSKENQDRQTANTLPMPLIHDPDPDLTVPEPEEPEEEKGKDLPAPETKPGVCPGCGKPMQANQRGELKCFNPECEEREYPPGTIGHMIQNSTVHPVPEDEPQTAKELDIHIANLQRAIAKQTEEVARLKRISEQEG